MTALDLRCRVPARLASVSAIFGDAPEPGDVVPVIHRDDPARVTGYIHSCAGCGRPVSLDFAGARGGHPQWSVIEGDLARPESVTLAPSILHDTAKGGCGWHGYLRSGVFEPC